MDILSCENRAESLSNLTNLTPPPSSPPHPIRPSPSSDFCARFLRCSAFSRGCIVSKFLPTLTSPERIPRATVHRESPVNLLATARSQHTLLQPRMQARQREKKKESASILKSDWT